MTREETKQIIRMLVETYPNYHPNDLTTTVDIWASLLSDYRAGDIQAALKKYILTSTSGFAPSPGQIIALIPTGAKSDMDAWAHVYKAICDSNYHAEERFSELDPIEQRAVGSPDVLKGWAMADAEDGLTVIQSQFLKAYRTECKRAQVNDLQIGENKNNLLEDKEDDTNSTANL
jgi:hypothetical protein